MKSFRSEVFELCKLLKRVPDVEPIKLLIMNLNVHTDDESMGDRSSFGYVSRHSHNQFFGYLFTDENVSLYNKDQLFKDISALQTSERCLLERGQATIDLFINEALCDLGKTYPNLVKVLNPYSQFKPIKQITADAFLTKEEISKCVLAFKNTAPYRNLINSRISGILKTISEKQLFQLWQLMYQDIIQKPYDTVSSDIMEMALKYTNNQNLQENLLFKSACLILALREMLNVVAQLMFTAMVGEDLIVLDNDNIISIEKNESNLVNKYMIVLVQDLPIRCGIDTVGSIVLIDCEPLDNYHIHEFGFVKAETFSMNEDTGMTNKLSFSIIDEDLNPIFNLTN